MSTNDLILDQMIVDAATKLGDSYDPNRNPSIEIQRAIAIALIVIATKLEDRS